MTVNRTILIPTAVISAITLMCIYFYFDPSDSVLFPKCAFHSLTGLQCPGCGSQRAIHALLHGDIAEAFHYNAMMVIALPAVILLCVSECLRSKYPKFYLQINSKWIIRTAFIVVAGWWIIRNIINQ